MNRLKTFATAMLTSSFLLAVAIGLGFAIICIVTTLALPVISLLAFVVARLHI